VEEVSLFYLTNITRHYLSVFHLSRAGVDMVEFSLASFDVRFVITSLTLLNAELNPICHLVALVAARHFVDVSRIWAKFGNGNNVRCKQLYRDTKILHLSERTK